MPPDHVWLERFTCAVVLWYKPAMTKPELGLSIWLQMVENLLSWILKHLTIHLSFHGGLGVLFMYKFVRRVLPPLFKGFFEHSTSDYDMRGQHLLRIPKCSSNFSQMRIRYTGTKLFNMLCSKVSRSCSYHTYKKNLKKYVIENSPIKNIYSSS